MNPSAIMEDQRFKSILTNESDKMARILNISPFDFGIRGDGIHGITLSYESKQRMNLQQARQLVIKAVDHLISNVNDRMVVENLNRKPIDISLFYFSLGFEGIDTLYNENEGEIAFVVISRGTIEYNIQKPNMDRFTPIYTESYEEACRIVFRNST